MDGIRRKGTIVMLISTVLCKHRSDLFPALEFSLIKTEEREIMGGLRQVRKRKEKGLFGRGKEGCLIGEDGETVVGLGGRAGGGMSARSKAIDKGTEGELK